MFKQGSIIIRSVLASKKKKMVVFLQFIVRYVKGGDKKIPKNILNNGGIIVKKL